MSDLTLADWIVATFSSALGPPVWEHAHTGGYHALVADETAAGCRVITLGWPIARCRLCAESGQKTIKVMVHAEYKQTWYDSPAALIEALNALAVLQAERDARVAAYKRRGL